MLVDAGLVGKGVAAHDGGVGRNRLADDARQAAAGGEKLLGDDAGGQVVVVGAGIEPHDDLFQGGVAGPLADAGKRHFGLTRAGVEGGQGVGHGQAQVVVAVDGEGDAAGSAHGGHEVADKVGELGRLGVAHGVGDVEDGRAGVYGPFAGGDEEGRFGARGVLGRELDLDALGRGVGNGRLDHVEDLGRGLVQLVLHVQLGGGQEGVDAAALRALDGFKAPVDVRGQGPAQGGHHRGFDGGGDGRDGLEIAFAGGRETGLDDVHAKGFELAGHADFFFAGHGGSGRLFAVTERGIKDVYPVVVGHEGLPFLRLCGEDQARVSTRRGTLVGLGRGK